MSEIAVTGKENENAVAAPPPPPILEAGVQPKALAPVPPRSRFGRLCKNTLRPPHEISPKAKASARFCSDACRNEWNRHARLVGEKALLATEQAQAAVRGRTAPAGGGE